MQRRTIIAGTVAAAWAALWLANTSAFTAQSTFGYKVLSHRGVHHDYDRRGLENDTCTATRIFEPKRPEIENTIASMAAAFELGADVVELDIHQTKDGQFAVFHDWTLDCRTDGQGQTRHSSMPELKKLDIGYGYTADGGKTFPLRGKGIGLIPSFAEVVAAFPSEKFLVNFKSNNRKDGEAFAARVLQDDAWQKVIWGVYGGQKTTDAYLESFPDIRYTSRPHTKACLQRYLAQGWFGRVPEKCQNSILMLPIDVAPFLWGWPKRFDKRMKSAGVTVVLRGPQFGRSADDGIDSAELKAKIPAGFSGYVFTNDPELFSGK